MRKDKLNRILNIIMGSAAGVFIGHAAYSVWDYKAYPGLYAAQSAPWYTSILVYGIFAAGVLLVCLVLKRIFRKSAKR